jgi:hypothetical protein
MLIENQLIDEVKPFIETGNLPGIIVLWEEWIETDFGRTIAWEYVFQKIYLHAALKKQKDICCWMDTLFIQFDPIQQIALRQMFSYAKYLLNKS